jgi:hypothetical protein
MLSCIESSILTSRESANHPANNLDIKTQLTACEKYCPRHASESSGWNVKGPFGRLLTWISLVLRGLKVWEYEPYRSRLDSQSYSNWNWKKHKTIKPPNLQQYNCKWPEVVASPSSFSSHAAAPECCLGFWEEKVYRTFLFPDPTLKHKDTSDRGVKSSWNNSSINHFFYKNRP